VAGLTPQAIGCQAPSRTSVARRYTVVVSAAAERCRFHTHTNPVVATAAAIEITHISE